MSKDTAKTKAPFQITAFSMSSLTLTRNERNIAF